jgi:hypothetical protein
LIANEHDDAATQEVVKLKVKKGKPVTDANLAILRRRNHSRLGANSSMGFA